ncbi:MAG: hypothetical protein AABM67_19220 [Acidobacteriota bacterium]
MEESSKIVQYFWLLVEQLPSLLAMIGCIVFALTRWKRYPKVSLLIVAGLGYLLLHALAFVVIFDVVPPLFTKPENSQNIESVRRTVAIVLGLLYYTGLAIAFALLLGAVFMKREPGGSNEPQPG